MKLKQEFSLFTSLLVVVVIASVSVAFIIYQKDFLTRQMEQRKEDIFSSFAAMSEEALILDDEILLLNYIKSVRRINPGIVYMFFDNLQEGYVLGEKYDYIPEIEEIGPEGAFSEGFTYSSPRGEKITEIASEIDIGGRLRGVARAGYSRDMVNRQVTDSLRAAAGRVAVIAIIAIILSILAAAGLAGAMTRPIRKLSSGAQKIGEGDLSQHISVKTKNEFSSLADEFNQMAEKLRKLDEMKDFFISSVSHELKSPLSYIKGYIELFLGENSGSLSEDQQEYFNIIKKNIARLSGFISDILELAKIKSGSMAVSRQEADIEEVARDALSFCRPGAEEKNIELGIEVSAKIPKLYFDGDKINQALQNLVGNALKFTPEGGRVTIGIKDEGRKLQVSVNDTGIGIPPEKVDSVFEKFSQVKDNLDKVNNVKGTGLGLSIVKGIIEAHGEKIWVESQPDKGSSFIFTLSKEAGKNEKDTGS